MCDASGEPAPGYLELEDQVARLTRERDEARERAAEVPGLRLRLAQAEGSASEAEAAWKAENGMRLAAESRAARLEEALRRIEAECDGPAHGIARAALQEEGE